LLHRYENFAILFIHNVFQAHSSTVAKALEDTGGDEVTDTVRFMTMVDKFFDCLNVNSITSGKTSKKVFQGLIRKGDFQLKVKKKDMSV